MDDKKKRGKNVINQTTKQPKQLKQTKRRGRKPKSSSYIVNNDIKTNDLVYGLDPEPTTAHMCDPSTTQSNSVDLGAGRVGFGKKSRKKPSQDPTVPTENIILHLPIQPENTMSNAWHTPLEMATSGLSSHHATFEQEASNSPESSTHERPYEYNQPSKFEHKVAPSPSLQELHEQPQWAIDKDCDIAHQDNWYNSHMENRLKDPTDFQSVIDVLLDERWKTIHQETTQHYNKKLENLMQQYVDVSNKTNTVPSSTPMFCFWCNHPFKTPPCVLPLKKEKGTYQVYGNFCCPECAVAYNFNEHQNSDKKWERYMLLHQLYRTSMNIPTLHIKPAPPRQALQIYGGPMNITQFRNACRCYKNQYKINYPPLMSVQTQLEEIDLDLNQQASEIFIPVDDTRIMEASENLKLKRKKPANKSKNTLESCMNLLLHGNDSPEDGETTHPEPVFPTHLGTTVFD